jgi:signal recognition particle subunit SRP54
MNASRRRRIAAGSGTTVEMVNRLLKQFEQMQKMVKQLNSKKGKRRGFGF